MSFTLTSSSTVLTTDKYQLIQLSNPAKEREEVRIGRIDQADEKTIAVLSNYNIFTKLYLTYYKKSHRELTIKSDNTEVKCLVSIDSVVKRRFDYQLGRDVEQQPMERQANAERLRNMTNEEFIDTILSDQATYHNNSTSSLLPIEFSLWYSTLDDTKGSVSHYLTENRKDKVNEKGFITDFDQIGLTKDEFTSCLKDLGSGVIYKDRAQWMVDLNFWNTKKKSYPQLDPAVAFNKIFAEFMIDYIILKTISPSKFTLSLAEYDKNRDTRAALGRAIRETKEILMKPESWATLSSRERAYVEREKAAQDKNLLKTVFLSKCLQSL